MAAIISSSFNQAARSIVRSACTMSSLFVYASETESLTKVTKSSQWQKYKRNSYFSAAYASLYGYEMKKIRPAFISYPKNTTRSSSDTATEEEYDFDLLVVGAGSGGIASARRAASYGAKVGVIEMGPLGGTCVNVGCVPKKIMCKCRSVMQQYFNDFFTFTIGSYCASTDNAATISETLHEMHHYGFSGYDSGAIRFDWGYIKRNRDAYIEKLNGIYDRNIVGSGVTRIIGRASLISSERNASSVDVMVTPVDNGNPTQKQQRYRAKHIILATGGYPTIPKGSDDSIEKYSISSDGFFDLDKLPRKAVVVGAGYIAVELAGVLVALGSDTSLVVRKERAMRNFDELISTTLDEEMEHHGINIYRNTMGVSQIINAASGAKTVLLNDGRSIEDVDVIIMAAGRSPSVESLDLDGVGVKQKEGGYIEVDEYSQTNVHNLYAVGDVCGNVELTPMGKTFYYNVF